MYSSASLTAVVLVLLAAVAVTAQGQDDYPFPEQVQPFQQYEADILDVILQNGTLSSLSDENIAQFLNNEASVNSVAGCFAGPDTCFSKGAGRLVDELRSLQPGTLCLDCKPGEEERLNEVIYLMVSGLTERYPVQWSIMFPHIFQTIATFQAKLAAQQQFQ